MQKRHREETIAAMASRGVSLRRTRELLSIGTTLHRLAEAVCNGDWPADNGERETRPCPRCERHWVPSTIKSKGCPDCRADDKAKAVALPEGWRVVSQGDPRGRVLYAVAPDGTEITLG